MGYLFNRDTVIVSARSLVVPLLRLVSLSIVPKPVVGSAHTLTGVVVVVLISGRFSRSPAHGAMIAFGATGLCLMVWSSAFWTSSVISSSDSGMLFPLPLLSWISMSYL